MTIRNKSSSAGESQCRSFLRSTADLAAEGERSHFVAISVPVVHCCLEHGTVPSSFRSGYVTPLLKKADLDVADVKSYRPITNLSVEAAGTACRTAADHFFLTDNGLLLDLQSAYRAHHSTETAVLKVVADILLALDCSNLALLSLLDLSAAFDTVEHDTLLRRLQTSYGLDGVVIKWFASYLSGRTQQRANTDHHVAAITCRAWSPSRIGPSPTC